MFPVMLLTIIMSLSHPLPQSPPPAVRAFLMASQDLPQFVFLFLSALTRRPTNDTTSHYVSRSFVIGFGKFPAHLIVRFRYVESKAIQYVLWEHWLCVHTLVCTYMQAYIHTYVRI